MNSADRVAKWTEIQKAGIEPARPTLPRDCDGGMSGWTDTSLQGTRAIPASECEPAVDLAACAAGTDPDERRTVVNKGCERSSADEALDVFFAQQNTVQVAIARKIIDREQRLTRPDSKRHEDLMVMGQIEGLKYALAMMLSRSKSYPINVGNCADYRAAEAIIAVQRATAPHYNPFE